MQAFLSKRRCVSGFTAVFLSATMLVLPLAGCSSSDEGRVPAPVDDSAGYYDTGSYDNTAQAPAQRQGMSTKKKLVMLAGAAALYYLYRQHQNAQAQHGPESQYYLSKNGRIYYRDEQGRAHWVTPPQEGILVPEEEAHQYRGFQGFQGRQNGMDLTDVAQEMAYDSYGGPGR